MRNMAQTRHPFRRHILHRHSALQVYHHTLDDPPGLWASTTVISQTTASNFNWHCFLSVLLSLLLLLRSAILLVEFLLMLDLLPKTLPG